MRKKIDLRKRGGRNDFRMHRFKRLLRGRRCHIDD
jgi:hypothetical protein